MKAIVWRKSVYDNNFKCPICGTRLGNGNSINDKAAVVPASTPEGEGIICQLCGYGVAVFKEVPDLDCDNPLQGSFDEFQKNIKKKAEEVKKAGEGIQGIRNENVQLRKKIGELESTIRTLKLKIEESRKARRELVEKHNREVADLEKTIRRMEKSARFSWLDDEKR